MDLPWSAFPGNTSAGAYWSISSGSTMLLHTCQKSDPSNFMLREVFSFSFTSKIISKITCFTMFYLLFKEHFSRTS